MIELLRVVIEPNDVLGIYFHDGDFTYERTLDGDILKVPVVKKAVGWQSAVTHHVAPDNKGKPIYRIMTEDEQITYYHACIAEQYPVSVEVPMVEVAFTRSAKADELLATIAAGGELVTTVEEL